MMRDVHYNPALQRKLKMFIESADWVGLTACLDSLSNRDFRTAGYLLGEQILPSFSQTVFWKVFLELVTYNAKAFLVTLMKSLALRGEPVDVQGDECLRPVIAYLNTNGFSIDKQKFILHLLPLLCQPHQVTDLFDALQVSKPELRLEFLLRTETLLSYYIMFQTLRMNEDEGRLAACYCHKLMHQGTRLSFNVASVLKSYFGLEQVGGVFSLQLSPFELSRLENSYDEFCKMVRRV